jgi:hypothetical protein
MAGVRRHELTNIAGKVAMRINERETSARYNVLCSQLTDQTRLADARLTYDVGVTEPVGLPNPEGFVRLAMIGLGYARWSVRRSLHHVILLARDRCARLAP